MIPRSDEQHGPRVEKRCQCGRRPPIAICGAGLRSLHAALGPSSSGLSPEEPLLSWKCPDCKGVMFLSFRDLAVT